MSQTVPDFAELLDSARHSAVHLEMRDVYAVEEEAATVDAWRRDGTVPTADSEFWRPWVELVKRTTARGVAVRRARIVSEPVSQYVRFEYAITPVNVAAGERVRWLSRAHASDLALPGNDFWLIDERAVRFNVFSGDGLAVAPQSTKDAAVARLCAQAFAAVWERAVPHDEYQLT
ncbi:hypothetical protein DMH18_26670 [Streptomyces sp. WAC 06783]|uniref:DUF6879 family protein n=1 Tax=Streptomyces sp. WAC 06783 TaxID=2203211 RepID=UPI000F73ADA2|nr:DUF6879 family protein [Streptomyces sp. WAC 06783]RSO07021.1 hypothetical protein DMH18_26670 [Streptomyces sp. WAC 06783]